MTILVFLTSAVVGISPEEWCWMIIATVSAWTAEALNTAFEFLCDVASTEFHPLVEKAKDVSAGAVLTCIIGASAIGFIILGLPFYDSQDINEALLFMATSPAFVATTDR